MTSVKLSVMDRPSDSLRPESVDFTAKYEDSFVAEMKTIMCNQRIEVFINPYYGEEKTVKGKALTWNVENNSGYSPNDPVPEPVDTCELADEGMFGAPYSFELSQGIAWSNQFNRKKIFAKKMVGTALGVIENKFKASKEKNPPTDLWLDEAARTMFMSYFVPLPDLSDGLHDVWKGLTKVMDLLDKSDSEFWLVVPLEFRFIRSGDTILAATYTEDPNVEYFANFDMIASRRRNRKMVIMRSCKGCRTSSLPSKKNGEIWVAAHMEVRCMVFMTPKTRGVH